jgi:phage terminase large subunit-like protein
MKGEIRTMAAGKTPKDGLYASVVHADEHGQASYVNGRSDMQAAVETCWGSTGPRREKLLMHTTTAGNLSEGPYKSKIESVEASLLTELDHPLGTACKTPDDYWFAFLLQLDKWEITDDLSKLDDSEIFKKVNRSIGTTVQPTYYRERLHEASLSDDTKKEVLTKDFNMWQTDKVTTWIVSADKVRQLQRPLRVTDCRYEDGWSVFVGMDFSSGEDLFAITYFCVNYRDGLEMEDRFFADTEAWVLESVMKESPNRPLYEMWVEQGWLHVCPGEVFNPDYAINKLMEKNEHGVNLMMFGYDPAQSKQPINTLKAWLQSIGLTPDAIKAMVVPVSQSFMTMNPIVGELEHYILTPWMHFSASPLWPWMAGNVNIIYSRDDTLRRLHKSGKHNKIDCFHALLDGIYVFDLSEGRMEG